MSNNDIKIFNKIPKRKLVKSQSFSLGRSILGLNWINKLRRTRTKDKDTPIFTKHEIEADEMIKNAEIHRQANRPLKKIKEFDGLTKFCQCCYNAMKDDVHVTNFHFCDETDEYAEFGRGISLYFFYILYSIMILLFCFCTMIYPLMFISKKGTEEIMKVCKIIGNNINSTIPFCDEFVNIKEDSIIYNNQIIIILKLNAMNLRKYREIYYNITNGSDNIDKILANSHFIYSIGLFSLFIIHSLFIILVFNINKQYNMSVTSPSDYAVIMTNLQSAFDIFYKKIKGINKSIRNIYQRNDLILNNFINPEEEPNSSRNMFQILKEYGIENFVEDNEINMNVGFKEFVKNVICGNEKGEKYNIYLINICYKINKFKSIQKKIKEIENEIYIAKKDPEQIKKNIKFNLSDRELRYFYHPLDIFDLYIWPFTSYEKSSKISELENKKQLLENKLKEFLSDTENLTKDNFSGVVFIIFNSMKEKDLFLESKQKNAIMSIIQFISNLKYFLCSCCVNESKKREFFLKYNISLDTAPEPEDIIYENLEFSWIQRLFRAFLAYIISLALIGICFFVILQLNNIQIKKSEMDSDDNIVYRYGFSAFISIVIGIINAIFQKILVVLTQMEKHICMTNYFLSYSIKLTILTFFSNVLIPYLSSSRFKDKLSHDILVTNCFTMFLSNSFIIPITWTINFEFVLKKLRLCIIKKKNKHLPQNELNSLYELLDMDIASKYSYVTRTLYMCFFYLTIFPLGVPICLLGFIFAFCLEKYNFIKQYKKPINLNSQIFEFYSNNFLINLFIFALGDYLFLKDVFKSNFFVYINIILFGALLIIPINKLLSIDLIGINEADLKADELYENNFYNFFNDYERNNPITKKDGIKHFLDKLLEKVLITKNDYDTILENYEQMNLLEIYYKSKLHFGYNLLKRAFFSNNLLKAREEKRQPIKLNSLNINRVKFIKNIFKPNNLTNKRIKNNIESIDTKDEQNKNSSNIFNIEDKTQDKSSTLNNELIINFSNQNKKIIKLNNKKNENKIIKRDKAKIKKLKLRKDITRRNIECKNDLSLCNKNTIEKDENTNDINANIMNINNNLK